MVPLGLWSVGVYNASYFIIYNMNDFYYTWIKYSYS